MTDCLNCGVCEWCIERSIAAAEEGAGNALAKPLVAEDVCPKCLGELDTGWECNDCGYDASHLAAKGTP